MKRCVVDKGELEIEKILELIEYIKDIELSNGLSFEDIRRKYTRRDCKCLTSLINRFFPDTKSILFILNEEYFHYVAELSFNGVQVYFDINGMKTFVEMSLFMFDNFNQTSGEICFMETEKTLFNNDITQRVLDNADFYEKTLKGDIYVK